MHRYSKVGCFLVIFVFAGILAFPALLFIFVISLHDNVKPIDGPSWNSTHIAAYSIEQAVELYGDDLLIGGLESASSNTSHSGKFILELHTPENIKDKDTWRSLSGWIEFGKGSNLWINKDKIYLAILFHDGEPTADELESFPNLEALYGNKPCETEIDGVNLFYIDRHYPQDYLYGSSGRFNFNKKIYYLESYSNENDTLFWDALNGMILDGSGSV